MKGSLLPLSVKKGRDEKNKKGCRSFTPREASLRWRGLEVIELQRSSIPLALSDGQMSCESETQFLVLFTFTANRRPVGGKLGLGQLRCDTSERATSRVL
jgi:hypothetical protein